MWDNVDMHVAVLNLILYFWFWESLDEDLKKKEGKITH